MLPKRMNWFAPNALIRYWENFRKKVKILIKYAENAWDHSSFPSVTVSNGIAATFTSEGRRTSNGGQPNKEEMS
jgi:hypothetical protein